MIRRIATGLAIVEDTIVVGEEGVCHLHRYWHRAIRVNGFLRGADATLGQGSCARIQTAEDRQVSLIRTGGKGLLAASQACWRSHTLREVIDAFTRAEIWEASL
jgi:hypothetical protein